MFSKIVTDDSKLTTYNKTEACENITLSNATVAFEQLPQLLRCRAITNISNKDFSWSKSITQLRIITITVVKWNRLRRYGYVSRKDENDWVTKCMDYKVEGLKT